MADVTYHRTDANRGMGRYPRAFLSAIWRGLIAMGENSSRYRKLRALSAMSDAELARRGIRRETIVHHVFPDVYYT